MKTISILFRILLLISGKTKTPFRCFLVSLIIVVIGFKAYPQGLTLGLKSGFDVVNIIETTDNNILPSKPSFHIELFSNYNFNKTFQMQIEPGFIEKGSWTTRYKDRIYKYGYFTLPTVLIFKPVKRVNIEIGSDFNYLIYANVKDSNGKVSDANFQEYYNHFEVSGIVGISYNFFKDSQLGVRFGRGFTPIYHDTSFMWDSDLDGYKFYNRYFEFFTRISLVKFDLKE